ncbi:hypothetical protein TKK_0001673 [Trichogramma kaykai]
MKVFLAAQVLSRSVAAALETCEIDLELEGFEGESATARFCRIIDDCFDMLNSRNKYNKCPSKLPITLNNLQEIDTTVQAYVLYIKNLKVNGQEILSSNKRTGFLGLIISMQNAVQLARDLFKEGYLDYLLTYKLSQDHLEMFFACIRKCGGFNNNPTTIQFKSAYRKLVSHVSIKVPLTANCMPLDDTLLMTTRSDITPDQDSSNDDDCEDLDNAISLCDKLSLSMYVEEVIAYVSGAVVKSILPKIKCSICVNELTVREGDREGDPLPHCKYEKVTEF